MGVLPTDLQATPAELALAHNRMAYRDNGNAAYGTPITWRPSSTDWGLDLDNSGAGGKHATFGGVFTIQDTGVGSTVAVGFPSLSITPGTLTVTGAVTFNSTLLVVGATTLQGNSTASGTFGVAGAVTLNATLLVQGAGTFQSTLGVTGVVTAPSVKVTTAGSVLEWTSSSARQTAVGGAGGASALPATPRGYLKVVDHNGDPKLIPYYDP